MKATKAGRTTRNNPQPLTERPLTDSEQQQQPVSGQLATQDPASSDQQAPVQTASAVRKRVKQEPCADSDAHKMGAKVESAKRRRLKQEREPDVSILQGQIKAEPGAAQSVGEGEPAAILTATLSAAFAPQSERNGRVARRSTAATKLKPSTASQLPTVAANGVAVKAEPGRSAAAGKRGAVEKPGISDVKAASATNAVHALAEALASPFPTFSRPLPEECWAAAAGLAALHGQPLQAQLGEPKFDAAGNEVEHPPQRSVMDSLVRTILSQNTTDTNSGRAFANLKERFPAWEDVRVAPEGAVEEAIKCGGLADIKVRWVKAILETLRSERGDCSLEHVRHMSDAQVKEELSRFKGVGKKTVACVLMFCLGRAEFPVDTHVWRISKSLGWVPQSATRDQAYEHLNARVPDDIKYDLHVLLVKHGKHCQRCAKNGKPRFAPLGDCPLFGASKAKS